jgi:hypothetical protein
MHRDAERLARRAQKPRNQGQEGIASVALCGIRYEATADRIVQQASNDGFGQCRTGLLQRFLAEAAQIETPIPYVAAASGTGALRANGGGRCFAHTAQPSRAHRVPTRLGTGLIARDGGPRLKKVAPTFGGVFKGTLEAYARRPEQEATALPNINARVRHSCGYDEVEGRTAGAGMARSSHSKKANYNRRLCHLSPVLSTATKRSCH